MTNPNVKKIRLALTIVGQFEYTERKANRTDEEIESFARSAACRNAMGVSSYSSDECYHWMPDITEGGGVKVTAKVIREKSSDG